MGRLSAIKRCASHAAAAVVAVAFLQQVQASQIDVIALSGQLIFNSNGSISTFPFGPLLNDARQAAFFVELTGTSGGDDDDRAVYRLDGANLSQIVRAGQAAPDGDGSFEKFYRSVLNNTGQVALWAELTGTNDGKRDSGIFRGDGSMLTAIVREGQATPDSDGSFAHFYYDIPFLNDAGQTAFAATLVGASAGRNAGVFHGNGVTLTQVARAGQAAPHGNGVLATFAVSALNDSGQTLFVSQLTDTSGGVGDNVGVFLGNGGAVTQIVRTGQAAPDGNGSFKNLAYFNPLLNNAGEAAFEADLTDTIGGDDDNAGIFRGNGATLTQIVRRGQAVPDGNGKFESFSGGNSSLAFNEAGQVAFRSSLDTTDSDFGIFRGDGAAITQIARTGQTAPNGDGGFVDFYSPALNDAGQVAFGAELSGENSGSGIFIFDDRRGLLPVVRTGDLLLGSVVTHALFEGSTEFNGFPGLSIGDKYSGLNAFGQVAFSFRLADGRSGIALWTIPEPSSLALIALAALRVKYRRSPRGNGRAASQLV